MPAQDKTGPRGEGPLTGRGLGPCGKGLAMRRGFGCGFGNGFGRGFGFRRVSVNPQQELTKTEEKEILEADLKDLKIEVEAIEKRLKEVK